MGGLYIWEKDNLGNPKYNMAIDMRETSTISVAANTVKTFTISASCVQEYDLKAGYNLVSLPFEPQNPDPAVTFPVPVQRGAAMSPVYEGQIYRLGGVYGTVLQPVNALQSCVAYWLYLSSPQTVTVFGTPGDSDPQLIFNRWVGVGFRNTDGMSQWRGTTQTMWIYDVENQRFTEHDPASSIPLGTGCLFYHGDGSR